MKELDTWWYLRMISHGGIFPRSQWVPLSLQRYASKTSEGTRWACFADRRRQKAVKDPLVQSHTGELAMAFSIWCFSAFAASSYLFISIWWMVLCRNSVFSLFSLIWLRCLATYMTWTSICRSRKALHQDTMNAWKLLKGYIVSLQLCYSATSILIYFKNMLMLQDCLGMLGLSFACHDSTRLCFRCSRCFAYALRQGLLDRPPLGHWFRQGSKLLEGPVDLHRCIGISCTMDTICCPMYCPMRSAMRCPTCLQHS